MVCRDSIGRFISVVAVFAMLAVTASASGGPSRIRVEGDSVVFETDDLSFIVGADGRNRAFIDRANRKDYLDADQPGHFMFIRRDGEWTGSTAVELAGPFLYVRFGDPEIWAKIHVRALPQYLTLTVTAVNAPGTEQFEVRLPLALDRVSHALTSARSDEFAAAVIPLNLETTSFVRRPALVGHADRAVRLVGASVAIIGAPVTKYLNVIETVEIENGLPHSTLDGVWARQSPEQMKSYLFVDLSERTADAMIDYAVTGGFGYIVVYDGVWNASHGTYPVNRDNFPGGEAGLKAVSDKIHAAGLKFGMHNLDMVVDKGSPLVQPVPEDGFMMYPDRQRVLAADIGADDTFIPATKSTAGLLAKADKSRFHGRDLRIGDEIVVYDDLQTSEPFGFTGCQRGARGTKAAAHDAGALIENFSEFIGFYRPNVKSDLYDRVARAEAAALDRFQFDYIYPDGIGENLGHWPEGPPWYISNLLVSKLFHYTRREVMFAHGPISNYSWHVFSRGNTTDFVYTGIIEHFDRVSVAGANYCLSELQPFEFGWFGYFTHGLDRDATRPREMEYAWSKALAYGAAMSLETNKAALDGNGRTGEIFSTIRRWEELKLAGDVPAGIRERLQAPGEEFTLERRRNGGWEILPVMYGEAKYRAAPAPSPNPSPEDGGGGLKSSSPNASSATADLRRADSGGRLESPMPSSSDAATDTTNRGKRPGRSERPGRWSTWEFDNPHLAQPLRVTIEAEPDLTEYGHAENTVLLEPGPLALYTEGSGPLGRPNRQTAGLEYTLDVSATLDSRGEKCFEVAAKNAGKTPAGWGCAEVILDTAEDLSRHRALGTWVEGDGSGAILHFVIEDTGRWSVRDYYVRLDFTGWRYIKMHQSAQGEVYDFAFPYSNYWAIRHINFKSIGRVYVFLSGVRPDTTAKARFARLEALKETPLPIQNPSLTVNGTTVTFAVTIEPDGYLDVRGQREVRLFDANGFTKAEVVSRNDVPLLKPGRNTLHFDCERGPKLGRTVNITIHTRGEPLWASGG